MLPQNVHHQPQIYRLLTCGGGGGGDTKIKLSGSGNAVSHYILDKFHSD